MFAGAAALSPMLACTTSAPAGPTPVGEFKQFDLSAVTDAFSSALGGQNVSGISLNAVKGGAVIYRRAFGTLAVGQAGPLGDATAMPSAMVLLALADAGKLHLDDTVAKYIPAFTGAITVRQLLTHTSGLPADAPVVNDASSTLEKAADAIARLPRAAKPGERFAYSAAGYQVAGRVAEVAGNDRWSHLFADRVANPTGLTGFAYGNTRNPRILDGATASPDDYARLLDVQLHDGLFSTHRVLSPASITLMQSDQLNGVPITGAAPTGDKGVTIGWGIDAVASDGKPQLLSVGGAAGAYAWLDLKNAYGACLLINGPFQAAHELAGRIQPLFDTALSRPVS